MENSSIEKILYINTECSPSHLFNNLTVTDKSIYYIHNSEIQPRVIVVDKKIIEDPFTDNTQKYVAKLNSNETNEMHVIKKVYINNSYYIAIGLYGGFKLWSADGERLLFQIPMKKKIPDKPYAFTSITEYKTNKNSAGYDSLICTDNYGQIFLVSGYGQAWKSKLLYSNEGVATTCCCSGLSTEVFAVGFETGEIFLFKLSNENASIVAKLDNFYNLPALCMGVMNNSTQSILVIGYLNGEVRFHELDKYEMVVSLGAHLRLINSIDTFKNCFVSCGDDCFVNIWKYDDEGKLQNIGNFELKDKMPVGVCILEKPDNKIDILVSIYDSSNLALIQEIKL